MASRGLSCSICAEQYEDSEDICSTRCGHIFHKSCLDQWIRQLNSCPMCSQPRPEPHRIFLDINIINNPTVSNTDAEPAEDHKVIIKCLKLTQITTPLYNLIQQLIVAMQLPITENDIKHITKQDNLTIDGNLSVEVSFKRKDHKKLFLQEQYKLQSQVETLNIRIHDILNPAIQDLLTYAHKLKTINYKVFYVENDLVYVKKHNSLAPINILSKEQVDILCAALSTNNGEQDSTSNIRNNNLISLPINFHEMSNEEILTLLDYSQKLENFGYEVLFEDNKVIAKNFRSERINILTKNQVDNLCENYCEHALATNIQHYVANTYQHNKEKEELFEYSLKLEDFEFLQIIYENDKVIVNNKRDYKVEEILSKAHVDTIYDTETRAK